MSRFTKWMRVALITVLCLSLSLLFVACGEPGEKGDKGDKGDTGAAGVGIVSIAKDGTSGNVDTYKITLTNGNTSTFTVTNGTNGSNGQNGADGVSVTNAQIVNGELILSFSQGNPINLGKVVGDNGKDGQNGTNGTDGKDGQDGADGKDGKDGVGIKGIVLSNEGELTITLTNDTPINLGNVKGQKGDDGQNGQDGVSVTGAQINDDGELVLSFSKGDPINLGVVVGSKGDDGISLEDVTLDDNGNLSVTYGGTTVDLGNIKGQKGDDGVSITGAQINDDGELVLSFSKGDPVNVGKIVGIDGINGANGKSAYEIYIQNNPAYTGDEDQWMSDLVNGKLATEQVVKYTITFDSNGGTPVDLQQVEKGEKVIQPDNPTREGYTFLGWYTGKYGDEKWVFVGYPVTEPITLTAKWQINSYTLTFDSNGGTPVSADTVVYNTNYTLPQPTKDNFVFAGWLLNGILYENSFVVKSDSTLVAKWVNPTYQATFDVNGGDSNIDPIDYNYGQAYELPTPTKIGNEFVGWFVGQTQITNGVWKFDHNLVLTAKWNPIPYTISFVTGTQQVIDSITTYYGATYTLPVPTKIGNEFIGWFDGDNQVTNGTWLRTNGVELTAKWNPIPYTISFVTGTEQVIDSITTYYGATYTLPTPTKIGNEFVGWFDGENQVTNGTWYRTNGVELTAKWNPIPYTISFVTGTQQVIDPITTYYGVTYTLPTPTKIGNEFIGWFDGDNQVTDGTWLQTNGVELTAKWNPIPYTISFNTGYDEISAEDMTVYYGDEITLPTLTKKDYQFCGWLDSQGNVVESGTWTIADNTELFADWKCRTENFEFAVAGQEITIIEYIGSGTDVVVPTTIDDKPVVSIDANAFANKTSVTSVTFDGSFTNFTAKMFAGCTSLQQITMSSAWAGPLYTLFGDSIADVPSSFTMVVHATGSASLDVTMWQSKVANHNVALTLASDVETIPADKFFACIGLTHVVVPEGVTSIGDSAFYSCLNLATISLPNSLKTIGDEVFAGSGLANVTIPASVTDISYTFQGAAKLQTVSFANDAQIKAIGSYAFYNCSSLTSIKIPASVTSIGSYAFYNCSSLTSIEIPASVTSIGESAFYDCSSLESVTFGENSQLVSIDLAAFYNCGSLTNISMPSSVTSIGYYAFRGCSSLDRVYITNFTAWCNISFADADSNPMCCGADLYLNGTKVTEVTFQTGTKTIGYQFTGCTSITSVTIPVGCTSIVSSAFSGCNSLTSMEIPASVTNIGDYAFENCSNLTSIVIPASVTSIGSYAFENCSSLTIYCEATSKPSGWNSSWNYDSRPVYWGVSNENLITDGNGVQYVIIDDVAKVTGYVGNGVVEIPSKINGYSVTAIGDKAFSGRDNLASIVIPSGVTSIGDWAFEDCNSLTSIEIPASVTSIGYRAFYNCSSLTSIVIPNSVTNIGMGAFYGCRSLQSITLPFVGEKADGTGETYFGYIFGAPSYSTDEIPTSLKTVVITGGSSIDEKAFRYCRSLISITIPNSVTSIGWHAFYDCYGLVSIVIPSSVTNMDSFVFERLSNLTIYCEATNQPSDWSESWNGDESLGRSPAYWYSENQPTTEGNYWHYVDGVVTKW